MSEPVVAVGAAVRAAAGRLRAAGVPSPDVDARALAEHVLAQAGHGASLLAAPRELRGDAAAEFAARFGALVSRREAREPLQHVLGTMWFRHLTLPAGPGVFVVRPETEALVDLAVSEIAGSAVGRRARVVDLCTGSGAIALALATERTRTDVVAIELEERPATSARDAAAALGPRLAEVGSSVDVRRGDATDPAVLGEWDGTVDLVVSNPPYIPPGAVPVDPEVRDHDPHAALYGGGADGLEIPRGVLQRALGLLRPGGVVLMEHADVQGAAARAVAHELGYVEAATLPDLSGRDRFLRAVAPRGGGDSEPAGEAACLLPQLCPECSAVPQGPGPCWRCGEPRG